MKCVGELHPKLFQLLEIMLFSFFLIACNSVASLAPTAISATATRFPPGIGQIAFYAHGIYIINADGTGLTQLAERGADKPTWSPDGQRIAFVGRDLEINVINADGSGLTRLTQTEGTWVPPPVWSPDGRQIAFSSFKNGGAGNLYVLNLEETLQGKPGSGPKRLNRLGVDAYDPAWSLDGQKISFSYRWNIDAPFEIALIHVEEALQPNDLVNWTTLAKGEAPAWSPDGQRLAFVSYQDDNPGISIMEANGSHQTRLTNDSLYPAWSPDGQRISFVSNRDGNWEVYVMDAKGDHQTRLTNNAASDFYPAWSPDGQQIAFVSSEDNEHWAIYVINTDGSHQIRLTDILLWPQIPMWAPR